MAEIEQKTPTAEIEVERVATLLGGRRTLRRRLSNPLDAHELLLRGLPAQSLRFLLENLCVLGRTASLEKAVGMSPRTFQRHKDTPKKLLNQEQSSRTWKFAKILAKATAV